MDTAPLTWTESLDDFSLDPSHFLGLTDEEMSFAQEGMDEFFLNGGVPENKSENPEEAYILENNLLKVGQMDPMDLLWQDTETITVKIHVKEQSSPDLVQMALMASQIDTEDDNGLLEPYSPISDYSGTTPEIAGETQNGEAKTTIPDPAKNDNCFTISQPIPQSRSNKPNKPIKRRRSYVKNLCALSEWQEWQKKKTPKRVKRCSSVCREVQRLKDWYWADELL